MSEKRKKLVILGATGSIGTNAIDVVRAHPDAFCVTALAALQSRDRCEALAKELAPSGIRVNCVAPGVIDTRMNARLSDEEKKELCLRIPLGRYGTPREAAEAIYFLTGAQYMTGQVLNVDGGFLI